MSARNLEKFMDPYGWDAQWVVTDEMIHLTWVEEPVADRQNDARPGFSEPRGWALKWDGYALHDADAQAILFRA